MQEDVTKIRGWELRKDMGYIWEKKWGKMVRVRKAQTRGEHKVLLSLEALSCSSWDEIGK